MSGRIRSIKPELLEDALIAHLSSDAFRLYIAGIVLADDYGNLRAEPRKLLGEAFWGQLGKQVSDVENDVYELWLAGRTDISQGLWELYRVREQTYAHVRNWEKHQRIDHVGKPRVPGPDDPERKEYHPIAEHSRECRETLKPDLRSGSPITIKTTTVRLPDGSDEPSTVPFDESSNIESQQTGTRLSTLPRQPLLTGIPSPEQEVFEHYVDGWHRHVNGIRPPKLNGTRRGHVKARLREGFTVDDLKRAIDGVWTPWNLGENNSGKIYATFELVVRNTEQVEKYLANSPKSPAKAPTTAEAPARPVATEDERRAAQAQADALFAADDFGFAPREAAQ